MDLLYSQVVSAWTGTWPRYALAAAWGAKERATTLTVASDGRERAASAAAASSERFVTACSSYDPEAATKTSSSSDGDSPSTTMLPPQSATCTTGARIAEVELTALRPQLSADRRTDPPRGDADIESGAADASETTEQSSSDVSAGHLRTISSAAAERGRARTAAAGATESQRASYLRQLYAVAARSFRAAVAVQCGAINVLQTLCMAVLVGLCWYQIPLQEDRVGDLSGYIFFLVAYWFFAGMYEGMLEFLPERAVMRRELQSGDYALSACFLGKTAAGCVGRVLLPWLFVTVTYFMVAVQPSARTYLRLSGAVVLSTQAGNSIGVLLGTLTTDYHVATSLTAVVSLGMMIVGGFYLKEIPHWLQFLGSLSAFRFAYRACIQVLFADARSITCMGGYWLYACSIAPYGTISGRQAVDTIIGQEVDALGVNVVALVLFLVVFRVLAYYSLLYSEFYSIYARKS
jgi:hypothetical protein